ncbi:hypothetical protein AR1Y2_0939 [Anaerostipes rhamnosivorans]|uniref:Uncharacterized protein n=1 Tax=Anaerostipes rhamnosivorans TaxID=1229621 RepID=A0A4P8IEY5_9FIRM|nr:hypothetical protein AR1Y2_0939 [Anaerostipes rhamnosivorans]
MSFFLCKIFLDLVLNYEFFSIVSSRLWKGLLPTMKKKLS